MRVSFEIYICKFYIGFVYVIFMWSNIVIFEFGNFLNFFDVIFIGNI